MKHIYSSGFMIAIFASANQLSAQDWPSLRATDTTDAVNTSSGAITTPGGGSVGKNFYCGGFYVTTGAASNAGGHLFSQGSGDIAARLAIYNSGLLLWGSGSAAGDTALYRDAAYALTMSAAVSLLRADGLGAIGMNRRVFDGSSIDSNTRHRWQITYNSPGTDFWRLEHYGANGVVINSPLAVNAAGDLTVDRQLIVGADPSGTGLLRVGGGADIKGTVRAKEIVVTLNGWSDSVFSADYRLSSLPEVDAYIQAHQHLPNVPSEMEIIQAGVAVGDMQKTQMAKIEELTLYAIEADRARAHLRTTIDAQQVQIDAQRAQIDAQQTQIARQQAQIDAVIRRISSP